MKSFESIWNNDEGLSFFVRGWEPDQAPKAAVALVHGLGEHTGRYAHVGRAFTARGYALAGFDLRGHGKSGGARGHFPSFQAVMHDIAQSNDLLLGRYAKGLPHFLYGHSLGGLLTLAYALHSGFSGNGVVVSAPGLRSALQKQKIKILLAKVLGTLLPTITLSSGLDPKLLSHDPKVIEAYVNDPLVHDKTTTGFGKSALAAIDYAFGNAPKFPAPLLVIYGSEDQLSYPSGGQDFVKAAPGDVTFKLWDGLYHEIHNEPEQGEVLNFMLQWLDTHLNKK